MATSVVSAQQQDKLTVQDSVKVSEKIKSGNGSDRNVMLNASSNSGPRDVNIGLPATVGGITILENDLPVVYFFWPELPNKTWRQSVSLKDTGLLKMEDLASNMGDLGFAVNSYTQNGTKDFHVKGNLQGSHFGWLQGDVNISGPSLKTDGPTLPVRSLTLTHLPMMWALTGMKTRPKFSELV